MTVYYRTLWIPRGVFRRSNQLEIIVVVSHVDDEPVHTKIYGIQVIGLN